MSQTEGFYFWQTIWEHSTAELALLREVIPRLCPRQEQFCRRSVMKCAHGGDTGGSWLCRGSWGAPRWSPGPGWNSLLSSAVAVYSFCRANGFVCQWYGNCLAHLSPQLHPISTGGTAAVSPQIPPESPSQWSQAGDVLLQQYLTGKWQLL